MSLTWLLVDYLTFDCLSLVLSLSRILSFGLCCNRLSSVIRHRYKDELSWLPMKHDVITEFIDCKNKFIYLKYIL